MDSQQSWPPAQSAQAGQSPQFAQRPRKRGAGRYFGFGCLGCLGVVVVVIALVVLGSALADAFGDKIALVRVEGAISGGRGGMLESVASSPRIVEALRKAAKDDSVKAVVLRVESPGGSAAASQEIYGEILRVKKAGKKVVVSMGDVAASGGYYVSCAADRIVANPGTITGSIGVIFAVPEMSELFKKIGFREQVVKSGKHKDMGSPARPLTPEEKQIVQGLINDVYAQFIDAVAAGRRGLTRAQIKRLADGRIYTGRQAMKLGLVDELGSIRDAIHLAARTAKLGEDVKVVEYGRAGLFEALTGGMGESRLPFRPGGLFYSPVADAVERGLR